MRQMQASAHAASAAASIPDGLVVNGLEVLAGGQWAGASAPVQSGNTVAITQSQSQALLDWKTFNVGKNTTVNFDQSAGGTDSGKWIAFNKISDPSGKPSQILGQIKADGQVYLINQNGIIFGAGSQVNARTLVASSLPINPSLFTFTNGVLVFSGLLNNTTAQFLFSGTGAGGDVTVQAGAQISSPASSDNTGGLVALIGPNVTNSGSISTPNGQTILAAGLQVGVAAHSSSDASLRGLDVYVGDVGSAGSATNSGLIYSPRASVIMIGKTVNQSGIIDSSTSVSLNGRIDLIANYGATINGAFLSTNSSNGLPFIFQKTGAVNLGPGSVTRILPETSSAETAVGTELALPSVVNIQGLTVHLGSNAILMAPGARQPTALDANVATSYSVALASGLQISAGTWSYNNSASSPASNFANTDGQIYLDANALIDVSGSAGVTLPANKNIITVTLRGSELANSALQRKNLAVRGQAITVDTTVTGVYSGQYWVGTPLADVTGYAGLIQRSASELTVAGGTVQLSAGNSVVLQTGATIDVSGGYVRYQSGQIQTTRLLSNGQLINIANATPDRVYNGIYTGQNTVTDAKWGVTKTFASSLAPTGAYTQQSYVQGGDAGNITIQAPSMALDGQLLGQAIVGPKQIRSAATSSSMPAAGSLVLTFKSQQATSGLVGDYSPTHPLVVFTSPSNLPAAGGFSTDATGAPIPLSDARINRVDISPGLFQQNGFGSLAVDNSEGNIDVPAGVNLKTSAGGSVTLKASNVSVGGSISAPAGTIAVTAYNFPAYSSLDSQGDVPPPTPGAGTFHLAAGASLSVAGTVTDDRPASAMASVQPIMPNAGSIKVTAFNALLDPGSTVDASGGVALSVNTGATKNVTTFGNGGSIAILAGQDPHIKPLVGGKLVLGGRLLGYSGAKAGSLELQAEVVRIGGQADSSSTLLLQPDFFNAGGFGSFTLDGLGRQLSTGVGTEVYEAAITIAPGITIAPTAQSLVVVPFPGGGRGALLKPILKPEGLRTPVSLAFNAPGVTNILAPVSLVVRGDIVMGAGSTIRTDAGASITFNGQTVSLLGSVYAPGGTITVTGATSFPSLDPSPVNALPTVLIGPQSVLSTAGKVLLTPDPLDFGRRRGSVLKGGTITITGNIVAESGAVLDVSGATGVLDLTLLESGAAQTPLVPANTGVNSPIGNLQTIPTRIDSNGGTITLQGGQFLLSDATLIGKAGGSTATGGSLIVSSSRFYPDVNRTTADINLVVSQGAPDAFQNLGATTIGHPIQMLDGTNLPQAAQLGYITTDRFQQGGFDSLSLMGNVFFDGPVSLSAGTSIKVAAGGVLQANAQVSITAPYVKLGQPFLAPLNSSETAPFLFTQTTATVSGGNYNVAPTYGTGRLIVTAEFIDVGTLTLQGIGYAKLNAGTGDIRGQGTLDIAGDLVLQAGQIYPVTANAFQIFAYDHGGIQGSVTIVSSGAPQPLPYSAGGSLGIYASNILQNGVLRAPYGSISLGWNGSASTAPKDAVAGTAATVPTTQTLVLSATSVTAVSAFDPTAGQAVNMPFGVSVDGNSWIAPNGADISGGGLPAKQISLAGVSVTTAPGSTIDIRGGGDLFAYQFVSGTGGTNDILGSATAAWNSTTRYKSGDLVIYGGSTWSARQASLGDTPTPSLSWTLVPQAFAIVPGYTSIAAPYSPFNATQDSTNLASSSVGYSNSSLSVGDMVYLDRSSGLPAGSYTLLPARYAVLPGAALITPLAGAAVGTIAKPDGSSVVSGYLYNGLNSRTPSIARSSFEVAPSAVVAARADYVQFFANSYLKTSAATLGATIPRLPADSGQLVFDAVLSMTLDGTVLAKSDTGGRGALVDISSPTDILITGSAGLIVPGKIVLSSSFLSSFQAASLLIGGIRGTAGTPVNVETGNITLDNAGAPLSSPEIILAANNSITLAPGAQLVASGLAGTGDHLLFTGNGVLLRVSLDPSADSARSGVTSPAGPSLTIGAGANISGASIAAESTDAFSLDSTATLSGQTIALASGQMTIVLDNPGAVPASTGLVLAGAALRSVESANSVSLSSYSTIDTYGTGVFGSSLNSLSLQTPEMRGFNTGGGNVEFRAGTISLGNSSGISSAAAFNPVLVGGLVFTAGTIDLGNNQLAIGQFATMALNASNVLKGIGSGGLSSAGNVSITTPLITAAASTAQSITAGGALVTVSSGGTIDSSQAGIGASFTLVGNTIDSGAPVLLPSGILKLNATGDITVGSSLDLGGVLRNFYDLPQYTSGGAVTLGSTAGNIALAAGSLVSVSAPGGAAAGSLTVSAPLGSFTAGGTLQAGGKNGGTFSLDVANLPLYSSIGNILTTANFSNSQTIRVRAGASVVVDGVAKANTFNLSADLGSITVSGTIDASGTTGGSISLASRGDLTLDPGAVLTVYASQFDSAGKGGSVSLSAGTSLSTAGSTTTGSGYVNIRTGSAINLEVASYVAGGVGTSGSSAFYGDFQGTLHIRAPQNAAGTNLQVDPINGTITGASSIAVEGYKIFDLTPVAGTAATITSTVQTNVMNSGTTFMAHQNTITGSLLTGANAALLSPVFVLMPGAEIINRKGDLVLGTASSTASADWSLSTFRFGTNAAPGVLTLRAAGNLVFYNALSDGFTPLSTSALTTAADGYSRLWLAPLMAANAALPMNTQSWSFNLASGADLSAANLLQVLPISGTDPTTGSVLLGKLDGQTLGGAPSSTLTTSKAISSGSAAANNYQVIRTGTGDINIAARGDVQLLNQFATIYTAGVAVPNPTQVGSGSFVVPVLNPSDGVLTNSTQGTLGAYQQIYLAQYSFGGGNVSIFAQDNIAHYTNNGATLIDDSSRQIPTDWLYRRGYVNASGQYGAINLPNPSISDSSESTTWWVDFSNFFEGVGALGGGNVTLNAGKDVKNVDAVAPTNARAPSGTPNAATLLELGGGNVTVTAGNNINAGMYYVERGQGTLTAGNSITTNPTRSPSLGIISSLNNPVYADASTYLPTTLFLGNGGFNVSARNNILLGPTANPFLLPEGLNNRFWYKTYFSTYSPSSYVDVTSLGGSVTFRLDTILSTSQQAVPILQAWLQQQNLLTSGSAANYYPWLRLDETLMSAFNTTTGLLPPTISATSFSSDIILAGNMELYPSATGNLQLAAAGGIQGMQKIGVSTALVYGQTTTAWYASTINVSDASPASIPGAALPLSYQGLFPSGLTLTSSVLNASGNTARGVPANFLNSVDSLFQETGATTTASQTLHARGLLHAGDTTPVRLYAAGGDLTDLTLFSPKQTEILVQNDIRDISFYLQNVGSSDVSIVESGRDIVAYDSNTPGLVSALSAGNGLTYKATVFAGDIQINGPGTLEVLAGRDLNLGTDASNSLDGTHAGIVSVGNARNPYLGFDGADIIAGAGVGVMDGLLNNVNFDKFFTTYVKGAAGAAYLAEIAAETNTPVNIDNLNPDEKHRLALQVFFMVLRDVGRHYLTDLNKADYAPGFAAIESLFGTSTGAEAGKILAQGRDIRTKNGGTIDLLVPEGSLTLASTLPGNVVKIPPAGIVTEHGGEISIFTKDSVGIGIGRIFTLRGGDITIWSSAGDIAAGNSSKTVKSAPPTRVSIDPISATVQTDLAGLSTGGGIGVLATVSGIAPGTVDLIAPVGTIDAGDAGIRATGTVYIAAAKVLNAGNITGGSVSTSAPTVTVSAPNIGGLTSGSSSSAAANSAANNVSNQARENTQPVEEAPSTITVEVLGYGGGDSDEG